MPASSLQSARRPRHPAAFTLVELLVVVSVMAILATMLLPAVAAVRDQARQTVCGGQLRQVAAAGILYAQEHDAAWVSHIIDPAYDPWIATPLTTGRWQHLLEPYLGTYDVLNCPVVKRQQPSIAIANQAAGWVVRGAAPYGAVCATALNRKDWGRTQFEASGVRGPMTEALMQQRLTTAMGPTAKAARCPVFFDGVWRNDASNQQNNQWGAYFPHRLRANLLFADGHREVATAAAFTSWDPVQVRE